MTFGMRGWYTIAMNLYFVRFSLARLGAHSRFRNKLLEHRSVIVSGVQKRCTDCCCKDVFRRAYALDVPGHIRGYDEK